MVAPSTGVLISPTAEEGLILHYNTIYNSFQGLFNIRGNLENMDREYQCENMQTDLEQQKARIANLSGDKKKLQNITVPVMLPHVEAGVTYLTNVFLSAFPLFGVVSDPTNEDAAMQMDAIIAENAVHGGWTRELLMFFRDGLKYNLQAVELDWKKITGYKVGTDAAQQTKQGQRVETIWEGNVLKRLNLYNSFWDIRCSPAEVYKNGDFAGYTELMSRVKLKELINSLPDVRPGAAKLALESTPLARRFYVPTINPAAIMQNTQAAFNWMEWATNVRDPSSIQYKNVYEVTKFYSRIIPRDFDIRIPNVNTPQIWKFIIVNHKHIIYAERQTNIHNNIPIFFGQPLEDGLDYQTKALAQHTLPFQNMTSALWNARLASARRKTVDRALYNPLMISKDDVNSDSPTAKIAVRNIGYGRNFADAFHQIPYQDDSGTFVQDAQMLSKMAEGLTGINPVQQGQFVKGNKTNDQFNQTMASANGRFQTCAILTEAQVFSPLKEAIKANILQYQGPGTILNSQTKSAVAIDPTQLRKSLTAFKVSDGLIPAERLVNSDVLTGAIQAIATSPMLSQGMDVAGAFIYLMKTKGLDLTPFKLSPQQMQQQMQAQQQQQGGKGQQAPGPATSSNQPPQK